ncbi:conserved Plasmodium protein, unknown function [Plasmodium vinckei vinckei]|uniref:Uncharacterized protein n=2 Tax=Plasmodium vinckei vinckei TaxID=54757 RepID=A0A449BM27_PLAVN|nr:conserved Plasmodium protein, unknown function [Plasmodium vinckei vinckei]VEV54484.1 conserved Plasmodium protein, unknown function [Plasmodium vinckei vinckei]
MYIYFTLHFVCLFFFFKMNLLYFLFIVCLYCINHSACIYQDNFLFTFKDVKKVHTNKKNVNKFEIEIIFKFNTPKDSKEFVLASLIPAKNLQILSFKKNDKQETIPNVEIHHDSSTINENDSCDYLITSKMYLLKLSKKELEMFNIYTYNFSNKDNNMIMPEKYEYSEKSLKSFFPSHGTIYPSDYSLKISVEVSKEGLDTDGIWIFAIGEKNYSIEKTQECTIPSSFLSQLFFQKTTSNNIFLLYCNSIASSEILNLTPDMRKSFNINVSSSKYFLGAHASIYSLEMDFTTILMDAKSDKIRISIKMPPYLCYSNYCFHKNSENPCLNLNINNTPFDECIYIFQSHEFILKSSKNEVVDKNMTIKIKNINNPRSSLEKNKNWIINILNVDNNNFVIKKNHIELLEKVSHDICSKKFILKLVDKYSENIKWVKSHIGLALTPELHLVRVQPINENELIENPSIIYLRLYFLDNHVFNKCLVEIKSPQYLISAITKSEKRFNPYTHELTIPSSIYKPVGNDQHSIKIETDSIKNEDIIKFQININKYKNKEYWYLTLNCLNYENEYVIEAQTTFIYPIENNKIYMSDIYYREAIIDNVDSSKHVFYLNLFSYGEKEMDISVSILPEPYDPNIIKEIDINPDQTKGVELAETCGALVHTSCYNLVYHKCNKVNKKIIYKINSHKISDKHFTILYPLIIKKNETKGIDGNITKFNMHVEIEPKNVSKNIKKIFPINMNTILDMGAKKPCINNLISVLKNYKKYDSHLFILFKAVNCYKIYEPFLINHKNNENFFIKTDILDNYEQITFQKTYKNVYPVNDNSISQKVFDKNIISIITIILIDDIVFTNPYLLKEKLNILNFIEYNSFFSYNKYYVVNYFNQNLLIKFYEHMNDGNVKITIEQKTSNILNILDALKKTISFAQDVKEKEKNYMNNEYSIMLLTDITGMDMVRQNSQEYVHKNKTDEIGTFDTSYENDDILNKTISRIYCVAFENGNYFNENGFHKSIKNIDNIYTYNDDQKDSIHFISFHKYIIDEQLISHYFKSVIQDYIFLHTQIYKASWYLIGVCRYNIIKNSLPKRTLHIYYVDKKVKTIHYTISEDETKNVFDNSSISSYQDMCNIFTQLKLLGYN